jgi:hypothetical protein
MCVIGVCKQKLDKDTFERCFNKNKDGFGFAWIEDGNVMYKKGLMELKEAWKEYDKHIFNKFFHGVDFTHIVHFRLGNPVCKELTHPFIVSDESEEILEYSGRNRILFHNGTITSWRDYLVPTFLKLGKIIDGKISDTRLAAIITNILGDDFIKFINGKFVVLSNTYFKIFGDFEKDSNGNQFSNDSYKRTVVTYSSYSGHKTELFKSYEDLEDVQEFIL